MLAARIQAQRDTRESRMRAADPFLPTSFGQFNRVVYAAAWNARRAAWRAGNFWPERVKTREARLNLRSKAAPVFLLLRRVVVLLSSWTLHLATAMVCRQWNEIEAWSPSTGSACRPGRALPWMHGATPCSSSDGNSRAVLISASPRISPESCRRLL